MNKVFLHGRLGRDPELSATTSGLSVVKFSLATSDRVKRGDQWEDATEWHNVVSFGNQADSVYRYLQKGSEVIIQGKLKTSSWDDKETGKKRYKTEIICERVTFCGNKSDRNDANQSRSPESILQDSKTQTSNSVEEVAFDDDDIPF